MLSAIKSRVTYEYEISNKILVTVQSFNNTWSMEFSCHVDGIIFVSGVESYNPEILSSKAVHFLNRMVSQDLFTHKYSSLVVEGYLMSFQRLFCRYIQNNVFPKFSVDQLFLPK